ncbi:MAG: glycosyltransferase family 2 protein [Clostridiales bacterium]
MKISVAMAVYNGMAYISSQIASILPQLKDEDELVISCDPSVDGSEKFLAALAKNDPRIRIFTGSGKGVLANFENAIRKTTGDVIFLCDQDDIWLEQKVPKVLAVLENKEIQVVLHDAEIVDSLKNTLHPSFFQWRGSKQGYWHNLLKNSYIGCCMAFRSEWKEVILPFPQEIPMHDQWIGLLAEKKKTVAFLNEPLIKYRRHGNNATAETHSSMGKMLKWRITMIKEVGKRAK